MALKVIKLEHINKSFGALCTRWMTPAWNVEKGEIICLIGPFGSGKSTLLRCINGLEVPEERTRVTIDGQVLNTSATKKAPRELQKQLRSRWALSFSTSTSSRT